MRQLLIESGLDEEVANQVSDGLHLDDDRGLITVIRQHLQTILYTLEPEVQEQLIDQDVAFMLSNAIEADDAVTF